MPREQLLPSCGAPSIPGPVWGPRPTAAWSARAQLLLCFPCFIGCCLRLNAEGQLGSDTWILKVMTFPEPQILTRLPGIRATVLAGI